MDKWDYSNLGDSNLKQRRHSKKSLLCLNFANNLLNPTAYPSKGLNNFTPVRAKSAEFRVTSVKLC